MCLSVKHEKEKMEKLKAPLSYCSFIIQILKRRKRKSWEVSQILIRHDQSALYTAAAKCSLFPWHFWVREHFTAVLCVLERVGGGGGGTDSKIRRGLARLASHQEVCLHLRPFSLCIPVVYLILVECHFSFFIVEALQTPELPLLQFIFLIGPKCPYGNDIHDTMSVLEAHFLHLSTRLDSAAHCQEKDHNKKAGEK